MSEKSPQEEPKRLRLDPEEYVLRRRLPKHLPKRSTDVYINLNTNFGVQMKKCQQMLDNSKNTSDHLVIHGLGKAVNRAINMALQLQESYHLDISCNTSSVEMVDDFEPIGANRDLNQTVTQKRTISAIHIKLYRKNRN